MKELLLLLFVVVPSAVSAGAQAETSQVSGIIEPALQSSDLVELQLREYLLKKVPHLPRPASAAEWTTDEKRIRASLLERVVFHGWPESWVKAPPKFEQVAVIETGAGYRIRKLRYEIVSGFQAAAILYEPEKLSGKVPAILNPNGHVGPLGKAVEYKQKRCINFARHGILARTG